MKSLTSEKLRRTRLGAAGAVPTSGDTLALSRFATTFFRYCSTNPRRGCGGNAAVTVSMRYQRRGTNELFIFGFPAFGL